MIVQDLYAGTLRLSELLRQSEDVRNVLENRIRDLEENLKLSQECLDISYENARYLEKQILSLEAVRIDSDSKIKDLQCENEEAKWSVQKWEQRAIQAENMFSILKQQVDLAQTRRVLSALTRSQILKRISCIRAYFLEWRRFHRIQFRRKVSFSRLNFLRYNRISSVFDCWRSVYSSFKIASYRDSQFELRNGVVTLIEQVAELETSSILIVQNFEKQHQERVNLSKEIKMQVTRRYESNEIIRRQVRVIRAIRYLNRLLIRPYCEEWTFIVAGRRRKAKISMASRARNYLLTHRARCKVFHAWFIRSKILRSLEIHRKLAVSVMSNNQLFRTRHSLINLIEYFTCEFEQELVGLEQVRRAKAQLNTALTRNSIKLPFQVWLSKAALRRCNRRMLQQICDVRPLGCRSYFRTKWIEELRSHSWGGKKARPSIIAPIQLQFLNGSAVSWMSFFNQAGCLHYHLGLWICVIRVRIRRKLLLAKAVKARPRNFLARYFREWVDIVRDSAGLTKQVRMDALSHELVDLAQAKVASEAHYAATVERMIELQEISSQQTAVILNLERLSRDAQTKLRDVQAGYEAAEGRRTVTRVLRVLSFWKRSRAWQAWSTWVCVADRSRENRNAATRLLRKVPGSLLLRIFASWEEALKESNAVADEKWVGSLQQQLVALAGLQAATETQLQAAAEESATLNEKMTCSIQDLENCRRSVAVMHIIHGSRFCRNRRIRRAWRCWLEFCATSAFKQRAVMRNLLNKLRYYLSASSINALGQVFSNRAIFTDSVRHKVKDTFSWLTGSNDTIERISLIVMHRVAFWTLCNKVRLFSFWDAWLKYLCVLFKYRELRKRCNNYLCALMMTRWNGQLNGTQGGMMQLDLMQCIFSESFSESMRLTNITTFTDGISFRRSDMFCKSKNALCSSKKKMSPREKGNYWHLIHLLNKYRTYFHHIQRTNFFLSWKNHSRRRKTILRGMQRMIANFKQRTIASSLHYWIQSHCKTLTECEKRKLESTVVEAGTKKEKGSDGTYFLLQFSQECSKRLENAVGLISFVRTVKIWASFLKLAVQLQEDRRLFESHKLETQLKLDSLHKVEFAEHMQAEWSLKYANLEKSCREEQWKFENELQRMSGLIQELKRGKSNAEVELTKVRVLEAESHIKCAVSRIIKVVRYLRRNLIRLVFKRFLTWSNSRRHRRRISGKIVNLQHTYLSSYFVAAWTLLALKSKIAGKTLKIRLLEENCASLLRMKEDAETRVSNMIELKKEIERTWSQKYMASERKFIDTKQHLDLIVMDIQEKYLNSATVRIFRVVTYFQSISCRHGLRLWRYWYLRNRFLRKTVVVFVRCMLGRAFDWWTLEAEFLKSLAIELSACSLERQLISVNERLHRRLHVSETQVKYVLEEQEQIQLVLDKRHRTVKTGLEMQLAEANQLRYKIGNMYCDIKRSMSALRILHVLKFWKRLLMRQNYVQWQRWASGKKKRRILGIRSTQGHALRMIVRHLYLWVACHYDTHVENRMVETQLSAAKEMNTKERDIAFMLEHVKSAVASCGEVSSRLKTTALTFRPAVTRDLAWVMRDLSRWKAEAEALRLEAEQQEQYMIISPR